MHRHEFVGEELQLADNPLQPCDFIERVYALCIPHLFSDDMDHGLNEIPDLRVLADPPLARPACNDVCKLRDTINSSLEVLQGISLEPWAKEAHREANRTCGRVAQAIFR